MNKIELTELADISLKVREHIIRLTARGGCFIGASLSCTDLIVYLYKRFLRISYSKLDNPDRDYLFLSKGHDVPALYGTFAELGWLDAVRLENHCSVNDNIYWHPNRKIPGVEFHSGSLGHLLAVSAGVAIDCKMKKKKNKVVTILGDGELNEGSVWESILVTSSLKLDNLVIVIDRNMLQANMPTERLIPLEPLERKFESFNCAVKTVNGHDFNDMENVFDQFPFEKKRVSVVIAETERGKGLPSITNKADRWFCKFTDEEVDGLLQELHGNNKAELKSNTMMVR
ncbi:MAG: hypothetical protein JW995_01660 [Melioribacteraceae bacterium]|nr:hypothetical protein [Melioribacteraceae bacterium]